MTNYNFAQDNPDSRDYTDVEVYGEYGSSVEIPSRVILDIAPPLDQGRTGACTVFGSTMAYEETISQIFQAYTAPFTPWKVWEVAKTKGASDRTGWLFQSALQLLLDMKLIGGYIRISATADLVDKMKQSLARGNGIATGIKLADWSAIIRDGEYNLTTKNGGHIFAVKGYDDNHVFSDGYKGGFYAPNSWGGIGGFWIRYRDISRFFSKYEMLPTGDVTKLVEAKKNRRTVNLQKAYDAKIWNESDPDRIASATELATMFRRGLGYGDNRRMLRYMVANMVNEHILRGKDISVYSGLGKFLLASDYEIAIMVTRGIMRNQGINELVLTRKQVAEVIGRDFLA